MEKNRATARSAYKDKTLNTKLTKIAIVLVAIVLSATCIGSAFGLYCNPPAKDVGIGHATSAVYTFDFDIDWIANDSVVVSAWVWYDGVDGHWEAMERVGSEYKYTVQLDLIYTRCIVARRPTGSLCGPDQATFGTAYNQTATLDLTQGFLLEHLTMPTN